MATSTEKALEKFFTPERRKDYRDLHERFPLWCGDWPEKLIPLPEARWWSLDARLHQETQHLGWEVLCAFFPDSASVGRVARPTFVMQSYDEEIGQPVQYDDPDFGAPSLRTLLAATHYTFQQWRIGKEVSPLPTLSIEQAWLEGIRAALTSRPGLRNSFLRALAAKTKAKRHTARTRLEKVWHEIGLEAGVIPYRRGGLQCRLPSEFLANLQQQGFKLVEEVIRVSSNPSEEHRRVVRPLIGPLDEWLSEQQHALLEELEPARAEARKNEMLIRADKKKNTEQWVLRLFFPMFSKGELDVIFKRTRGKTYKRSIDAASTDLLAHRLLRYISRTTILNRIRDRR